MLEIIQISIEDFHKTLKAFSGPRNLKQGEINHVLALLFPPLFVLIKDINLHLNAYLGSWQSPNWLQSIYNSFYNLQFYSQLRFIIPNLHAGDSKCREEVLRKETMEKKKRYLIDQGGHFEDF